MRRRRHSGASDSLAYLDIITCGFGAIIMLLIIIKPIPDQTDFIEQQQDLSAVIENIAARVSALRNRLWELKTALSAIPDPAEQTVDPQQLDQSIAEAQTSLQELKSSNQALEVVKQTLLETNITQTTEPRQRDIEVGGIPVDSEYVIFIVDTSGSMQEVWSQVVDVMGRILDIHPKVRGFQVMNDNGNYLLESTKRKWLSDSPRSRQNVKDALLNWLSFSSSSPVEGLEVALRTYKGRNDDIAIYILGDEFTGSSYDAVISTLEQLNLNTATGQPEVRVHSIGFPTQYAGSERYAVLMRNVVERNRGAFLGLPK